MNFRIFIFSYGVISKLEKIDIVYLWCDGYEENFLNQRKKRLQELNHKIPEKEEILRYKQHNELKYSLRSVQKYAPWINHIFIVTNNQTPDWLKENPKITIVDHKEIIPEHLLPCFNSQVIEQYIINIKDLSEHFLYANDDMFFAKKVKPEDFFYDGKPIVYFGNNYKNNFSFDSLWKYCILNSYVLALQKLQVFFEFRYTQHSIDAYTKTILKQIFVDYPELLKTNIKPFRNKNGISRVFWSYIMSYKYNCHTFYYDYQTRPILKTLKQRFSKISPIECVHFYIDMSLLKFKIKLIITNPKTICLNNFFSEKLLSSFLEKKYNNKCEWEK